MKTSERKTRKYINVLKEIQRTRREKASRSHSAFQKIRATCSQSGTQQGRRQATQQQHTRNTTEMSVNYILSLVGTINTILDPTCCRDPPTVWSTSATLQASAITKTVHHYYEKPLEESEAMTKHPPQQSSTALSKATALRPDQLLKLLCHSTTHDPVTVVLLLYQLLKARAKRLANKIGIPASQNKIQKPQVTNVKEKTKAKNGQTSMARLSRASWAAVENVTVEGHSIKRQLVSLWLKCSKYSTITHEPTCLVDENGLMWGISPTRITDPNCLCSKTSLYGRLHILPAHRSWRKTFLGLPALAWVQAPAQDKSKMSLLGDDYASP
ncbi:hypothetical protein BCON_0077g00240 [Botryotinia convoluta]|uniref:Uncharacterized protein n=1 Tax=Botryotinia convoluta TaxID=54673 RepID=A0A4Z1IBZ2_9HELO|nr:hypothetical protein BCON_0077g00240 [Botryotinia convoluta]